MTDILVPPVLETDLELLAYCQRERVKVATKLLATEDPKSIAVGLKALDGISTTILRKEQNGNEKNANDIADRALRSAERNRRLYASGGETIDATSRPVGGRKDSYVPGFVPGVGQTDPVGTTLSYEGFTSEQEATLSAFSDQDD